LANLVERSPERRIVVRLIGVLCALALISADLFRGIHLLTTRHVVCAEHGELIHADEGPVASSQPGVAEKPQIAPGNATGHHHDHCDLAAARPRTTAAVAPPRAAQIPSATPTTTIQRPDLPGTDGLAVLIYAPKQSPPV
jgi:hypothetical protein